MTKDAGVARGPRVKGGESRESPNTVVLRFGIKPGNGMTSTKYGCTYRHAQSNQGLKHLEQD